MIAQKYRLIRPLGDGTMGVVWLAINGSTGGEVALKLIVRSDPGLRQRLLREAHVCCSIRHRNVIRIHDVDQTDDGDPFLVMELLSGETLAEMLRRRRRLSQEEAASIGRDIARALSAAHEKDIVHRDLKPANIVLHEEPGGDGPVVKVLDFGVSKSLIASDGMCTVPGHAVGSPMYMSPEQARADSAVDGRADIWSLGVVLFEMLTGQRPFAGEPGDVIQKVLTGDIPTVSRRVRKIDPAFDQLVAACLSRRREDRPWPASEVARRLEALASPLQGRGALATLIEPWNGRGPVGSIPPPAPIAPSAGARSSSPSRGDRPAQQAIGLREVTAALADEDDEAPTRPLQLGLAADLAQRGAAASREAASSAPGRGETVTLDGGLVRGGTLPLLQARNPPAAEATSYTWRGTLRMAGLDGAEAAQPLPVFHEPGRGADEPSFEAPAPPVPPSEPPGPATVSTRPPRDRSQARTVLLLAGLAAVSAFVTIALVLAIRHPRAAGAGPGPEAPPTAGVVAPPEPRAPALPAASTSQPAAPSAEPVHGVGEPGAPAREVASASASATSSAAPVSPGVSASAPARRTGGSATGGGGAPAKARPRVDCCSKFLRDKQTCCDNDPYSPTKL